MATYPTHNLSQKEKEELKKYKKSSFENIMSEDIYTLLRNILSLPFIYGMIIPGFFMHICLEIYHQICFRLYKIPLVSFQEYFAFDRMNLPHLNFFEKINCLYCSYFNCLVAYTQEIAGRTERFWCPIKHEKRLNVSHNHYSRFFEYTDGKSLRKNWKQLKKFEELQKNNTSVDNTQVCIPGKN